MRRFFYDFLFTILLFLAVVLGVVMAIFHTPNEYSYKHRYMTEQSDGIKTLLLGNSFFANSINPYIFGDSVFDGAMSARPISIDKKILDKYISKMPNLTTVIIPVHAGVFEDTIPSMALQQPYVTQMGLRFGHGWQYQLNVLSESFYWRKLKPVHIVPSYRDGRKMLQLVPDSLGYSPLLEIYDGHTLKSEVMSYEQCNYYKEAFYQCTVSMAKKCETSGIRLIFVQPPVSNTVLSVADYKVIAILDSIMNYISRNHNCEYLNYFDDKSFRSDSLYCNDNHLNHIGATLFAERIKEDCGL